MRVQQLGLRTALMLPGVVGAAAIYIARCAPGTPVGSGTRQDAPHEVPDAGATPDAASELQDDRYHNEAGADAGADDPDALFDQEELDSLAGVTPAERDIYIYLKREMRPVFRLLASRLPPGITFGFDWVTDWDSGGREVPAERVCVSPNACRWEIRATIRSFGEGDWHRVPIELPRKYVVSAGRVGGEITVVAVLPTTLGETREFHSVRELESFLLAILNRGPVVHDR